MSNIKKPLMTNLTIFKLKICRVIKAVSNLVSYYQLILIIVLAAIWTSVTPNIQILPDSCYFAFRAKFVLRSTNLNQDYNLQIFVYNRLSFLMLFHGQMLGMMEPCLNLPLYPDIWLSVNWLDQVLFHPLC